MDTRRTLLCLLGAAWVLFPPALPAQEVDRAALLLQVDFVHKLIEESSAAKQVEEAGIPEAAELRATARELYEQAQQELKAEALPAAKALLDSATKKMFEAVRAAGKDEVVAEKRGVDFDNRLASLDALVKALGEISKEKGKDSAALLAQLAEQRASAVSLRTSGDLGKARTVLDGAYQQTRQSIEELRRGDTLVRSLNFASKKEEYAYELDRNDTHRMLLEVLSKERSGEDKGLEEMVQKLVATANEKRSQAEHEASMQRFENGIALLEEATTQLIRALRLSGTYIPG
ncbi:MAG: hypothetical protein HYV63_00840 [Candidatus Schekmanbacteria bacterium]|nr:hypothetical protein [Candidatus Schekmanbacteria bacterium]